MNKSTVELVLAFFNDKKYSGELAIDSRGNFYFATDLDVYKFDGKETTTLFYKQVSNTRWVICRLLIDSEDNLYIIYPEFCRMLNKINLYTGKRTELRVPEWLYNFGFNSDGNYVALFDSCIEEINPQLIAYRNSRTILHRVDRQVQRYHSKIIVARNIYYCINCQEIYQFCPSTATRTLVTNQLFFRLTTAFSIKRFDILDMIVDRAEQYLYATIKDLPTIVTICILDGQIDFIGGTDSLFQPSALAFHSGLFVIDKQGIKRIESTRIPPRIEEDYKILFQVWQ